MTTIVILIAIILVLVACKIAAMYSTATDIPEAVPSASHDARYDYVSESDLN